MCLRAIQITTLSTDRLEEIGYYPQLSVGQADNLPDRGDVTEGLLGFRESAGVGNSIEDGTANVQELCGESVVWNNQNQNDKWGGATYCTFTLQDNEFTIVVGEGAANATKIELSTVYLRWNAKTSVYGIINGMNVPYTANCYFHSKYTALPVLEET